MLCSALLQPAALAKRVDGKGVVGREEGAEWPTGPAIPTHRAIHTMGNTCLTLAAMQATPRCSGLSGATPGAQLRRSTGSTQTCWASGGPELGGVGRAAPHFQHGWLLRELHG